MCEFSGQGQIRIENSECHFYEILDKFQGKTIENRVAIGKFSINDFPSLNSVSKFYV